MATRYDNIGKGGFVKEGVFVRFPDLIPACPDNWDSSSIHGKLMIVGESNYFKDDVDSVFKDPEAWYRGKDTQHLIPDNMKFAVSNEIDYTTFDRVCITMSEVSGLNCKPVFKEAMFYNYFLRPATVRGRNKSFKKDCTQIDRDVAGSTLCEIIELDKPDIVIFVSKYAYSEFTKYTESKEYTNNIPLDFVNHPSHPAGWWNYKTGNGIQKFERLLREYWIKK